MTRHYLGRMKIAPLVHALGMLWLCSWLAAAATTPQRRSTLLYNHNPKAGGGTIIQVLRRATPRWKP